MTKKAGALDLARALDVAKDSGLDVTAEPWGEVALRAITSAWYADHHPKEADVAELLKESSMSQFGVPKAIWEEARLFRKLQCKAGAEGDLA